MVEKVRREKVIPPPAPPHHGDNHNCRLNSAVELPLQSLTQSVSPFGRHSFCDAAAATFIIMQHERRYKLRAAPEIWHAPPARLNLVRACCCCCPVYESEWGWRDVGLVNFVFLLLMTKFISEWVKVQKFKTLFLDWDSTGRWCSPRARMADVKRSPWATCETACSTACVCLPACHQWLKAEC